MARKPAKLSKKQFGFFFHFLGHKSVYFHVVNVKKILVDHIRLFGRSENELKIGFLWKWCKKCKKKCLHFIIILECVTKIPNYILYFEGPGRRNLSENSYYQKLSGEKKGGIASECGVEI